MQFLRRCSVALLAAFVVLPAVADEAAIRKALAERMPDFPKIDEISKTPVPGLYEVRFGNEILYTDEQGNYLIDGTVLDTKTRTNLTEARLAKLNAIDFASLPLKDAIVWKQGTGARKLVVFADPNCQYCKKFERDLQNVKDVTVYTFLYPILGGDSPDKSRNIWCAKDNTKVWRDWMVNGTVPPRAMGTCDLAALARNMELGKKHRVNGTPALVFEDGRRVPGAVSADQLEKQLTGTTRKAG
jgi:thiol:disulfide interchange protein DsbC